MVKRAYSLLALSISFVSRYRMGLHLRGFGSAKWTALLQLLIFLVVVGESGALNVGWMVTV